MKKFLQLLAATVFALFSVTSTVKAQCPNDNDFFFAYGAPTVIGASVGSEVCIYAGEYYVINNMVAGSTYRISSCGSADIVDTRLTVYANSGGPSLAFNDDFCGTRAQLDFTPTTSGSYRILLDQTGPGNTCASTISAAVCGEIVVTLISTGPSSAYCVPQYASNGGTTNGDFINRVALGSIDNANSGSQGGPSYTDFSNLSTNLLPNTQYVLTVQNNPDFTENVAAWIDYNGDLTFSASEKLGQISIGAGATSTITFTTPAVVNAGATRLRVRMAFTIPTPGSQMDPCAPYQFGEAEDYRVVFPSDPPGPSNDLQFSTICGLNTSIQDNACPNFTNASVTASGLSSALGTTHRISSVDVIIEHPSAVDLDLFLEAPNGNSVELSTDNGNGGANYGAYQVDNCTQFARFSMSASNPIVGGTAPFIGTFIPEGNLNSFNTSGINPNGIWRLRACDDFAGDVGVIRYFRVNFELISTEPPACAASYNLADAATGVPSDQQLSWVAGAGSPTSYDVYFGTTSTPPLAVQGQSGTSYDPGTLNPSTTYFYQIVPVNEVGPAVGCPVRSFTTADVVDGILMQNGTVTACSGLFFDSGGANGNYGTNENLTLTILPETPGSLVSVTFTSFSTELNLDGLSISVGSPTPFPVPPVILSGSNITLPFTVTSNAPDGSITFTFNSNGSVTGAGWEATIECITANEVPSCAANFSPADGATGVSVATNLSWTPGSGEIPESYSVFIGTSASNLSLLDDNVTSTNFQLTQPLAPNTTYFWQVVPQNANGPAENCDVLTFITLGGNDIVMSTDSITTCSGSFFDSGGSGAGYGVSEQSSLTIFPSTPGSSVQVEFTSFELEDGFDLLAIVNGSDPNNFGEIIGFYSGVTSPGTVVSTALDGALTFVFVSDDINSGSAGWEAEVSCVLAPAIPSCADAVSPLNDAVNVPIAATLNWTTPDGEPDSYEVFLGTTAQNLVSVGSVTTNTFDPAQLEPSTTYFWQVIPSNEQGSAQDCPVFTFTTATVSDSTVWDVIVNSPVHTTLESLVLLADLDAALQGDGPLTVFAPTDAAFQLLPQTVVDALIADPSGALTQVLLYHVIAGLNLSSSLSDGQQIVTLNTNTVTVSVNANGVFINDAEVIVTDILADNGVVHVIDAVLVPPAEEDSTVWDVIVNSNVHNTLETLVGLAGLDDELQGPGPLTVFAPTDNAFTLLPQTVVDALLADPTGALAQVLLYHVVAGQNLSSSLSDGQQIVTLNTGTVTVTVNGSDIFINDAQVIIADILADNGVVHVIDAVLVPPVAEDSTVWDVIVNSPVHTTLETLVSLAGLDDDLQGAGPFTVFAPTDNAFTLLPQTVVDALLADPTGALAQVLLYHVVAGQNLSTDLSDGQQIVTLNTGSVTVSIVGNDIFINDSQVIIADILTDNGVVHVIDAVLIPADEPSNDILMQNGSITACEGNFFDTGGLDANYQNNEELTLTITPSTPNTVLRVNFSEFSIEEGWDFLNIFDGNSVDSTLIGEFTGTDSPGIVTSTAADGALTFVFTSDGSATLPGWEAIISCVNVSEAPGCAAVVAPLSGAQGVSVSSTVLSWAPTTGVVTGYNVFFGTDCANLQLVSENQSALTYNPGALEVGTSYAWRIVPSNANGAAQDCPCNTFTTDENIDIVMSNDTISTCGANFFDSGGINAEYSSNEEFTLTITPNQPNSAVQVTFNSFSIEEDFEFLTIFNGNSTAAPLIDEFTGEPVVPFTIVSSSPDGSLTFTFESDGSVELDGWEALISCVPTDVVPVCAQDFFPADLATDVPFTTNLNWTSGGGVVTGYNVFFGTDAANLELVSEGQTGTSFNPGTLDVNTTYFWQVVPVNAEGEAVDCQVLSFTTQENADFVIFNGEVTICEGNLFDTGGADGQYDTFENITLTIFPSTPGSFVQLDFVSFATEDEFDFLDIFNGNSSSAPLLLSATGSTLPATIVSTAVDGSLTLNFTSDVSLVDDGFEIAISCVAPTEAPVCATSFEPADDATDVALNAGLSWALGDGASASGYNVFFGTDPSNLVLVGDGIVATEFSPDLEPNTTYFWQIVPFNIVGSAEGCPVLSFTTGGSEDVNMFTGTVTTCNANFFDSAGPDLNYANNENFTLTFFPDQPNSAIQVIFSAFNTEATWDGLYVYDGPDVNSPQIASANGPGNVPGGVPGAFWGTVIPGPFISTHPSGALTFVFRSDLSAIRPGWAATVACIDASVPPGCPTVVAPLNNATGVSPSNAVFSWTAGSGVTQSYDVFFGTDCDNLVLVSDNQTGTTFSPGQLDLNTTYFWSVVGVNANGPSEACACNSFTTSGNIDILMSNATISTCSANFYDSGGLTGNYLNSENFTLTITPDQPNSAIQVFFTAFNLEATWDGLYVYNGPDINSPQIASANGAGNVPGGVPGAFWGTTIPGPFTSTHPSGALTFVFRSDFSVVRPGWEATVACVSTTEIPACANITAGPADGATGICLNEALVTWTPGAGTPPTGYDIYFEIDGTGFVLLAENQTSTSFDPGFLQPNTTYSYIIVPTNANGDAVGCDTITFTTGTCLNYCDAGATICDEFISNVQMGDINNETGCGLVGGYSDYTALSTQVFIGTASPITVTNGNPFAANQLGIWVDWNQDGDFGDANETIAVTGTPGTGPYTANVTPPADALPGPTRMRIRLTFTGIVDPCGTTLFGEVEDYTIIVNDALDCPFPNNIVFSETTADATIVSWDAVAGATEYLVRYRAADEPETVPTWTNVISVSPPDNFTFFLDLQSCTDYIVQVAAPCPDGTDTVFSTNAIFQTRCIVCEPDFITELEPCGQNLNGGCNSTPPSFETIACGQTICGTSFMNTTTRDTDWFELVVTNQGVYTVNILAEFDGTVFFADATDCDDLTIISQANFTATEAFTLATSLAPGTYSVILLPSFDQPVFDCNGFNAYTLELSGGETQIAPVADVCVTSDPITLFAVPSGGTWSGDGITNEDAGTFDPSETGVGSFEITYNATSNGCASSATITINVIEAPAADFVGLAATYCPADADVQLTGIPAGGVFTIDAPNNNGISGNVFSPSVVGTGSYAITYTVNTNGSCASTITQNVTVNAAPAVNFSLADSTCNQDDAITLSATPAGGVFSGAGVTGTTFNPALAGVGAAVVTYTYTEAGQSCPGVASQTIQINAAPVVSLSGLSSEYCLNSEPVTLVGTPSLGTFSGPGVTGNVFDASAAGIGQHTIRYEFDNGTCVGFDEVIVTVGQNISVTTSLPSNVCSDVDPFVLTSSPAGAVFSGPGVSGGTFSPAVAGVGTHTITATLVIGSCVATSTQTITVSPAPVASFNYSANGANVAFVNSSVNATSYSWNFGDNTTSTAVNPTHTYTANGAYTITLVASSGSCTADTFSVDLELSVGIGSIEGVDMIQLYPNPTHGDVNLAFFSRSAQTFEVRITDATGRLIRSENLNNYAGQFNKVYDISDLARGMYNFSISSDKGAVTFRVVRH